MRLPLSRPLSHVPTLSWVSLSSRKPSLCDGTEADDTAVQSTLESSEGISVASFPFLVFPALLGSSARFHLVSQVELNIKDSGSFLCLCWGSLVVTQELGLPYPLSGSIVCFQ